MSEYTPLKHGYDEDYIGKLAQLLAAAHPALDAKDFVRRVFDVDWPERELKARMEHIADTIDKMLPEDMAEACGIVDQVVGAFDGYLAMFFPAFVEKRGLKDVKKNWKETTSALARYTPFSSSEFAVRPFIVHDQQKMMTQMLRWTKSSNEHVRRLASEGCRPRLPWAMALPALKQDPAPILPVLEALRSDESEYVRRSVANNLNDISKDHPELVLEIAERWLNEEAGSVERQRLVKHACRTLLKAGSPRALLLFGFSDPAGIKIADLAVDSPRIKIGDKQTFRFKVNGKVGLGRLRIEYVVHYVKKNGDLRGKVFQLSEFETSEKSRAFERRHAFKDLSTRRHFPGRHEIAVIINGVEKARTAFELLVD